MAYADEFNYSIRIHEQEQQYIDARVPPALSDGPGQPYVTESVMDDHVTSLADTFYFTAFQGERAVTAWKGPVNEAQSLFYTPQPG